MMLGNLNMVNFIPLICVTLFTIQAFSAAYDATVSNITPEIKQRMIQGNSWQKGCPVSLDDLRYLRLKHKDFNGNDVMGELIVHKGVAHEVVAIFETLYKVDYPYAR